ncbi:hypothetical protein LEP1GSC082_4073 [Leptospira kirschneri str. H2]|uniref:Uncharacterized protein n=2 Tax=Leptospira kirschneri TaxID=29507 RepID=A0A0E2B7D1_9LEPT|nr:hypothetical protein LEP1GSC081_2711 [Leptospira kirschneri str. H1]EKO61594.1 hypothetical protein LEP1GSC082_4073 [Leptospira kirschneri str. H2]EMK20289.1 hypothetical protein LEP1GSC008_0309 [Leptospira kirschneri serovar Bulgarica str. Nikolaevo]
MPLRKKLKKMDLFMKSAESRVYGLADSRSFSTRTLRALQPAHAKKVKKIKT